ncbi:MAG: response regulator transcription factor [Bacteroidota bacterium]
MKILLIDDQSIVVDGISRLLTKSVKELVEQAKSIDDALHYFDESEFDILVTEYNLIDSNGIQLLRKIKRIYPNIQIIVLSMQDESRLTDLIAKDNQARDLVNILEEVGNGKIQLSKQISDIIFHAKHENKKSKLLSSKEDKVLQLIAQEYTKQEIAKALSINEKSVESYHKSLLKKTKTSSIEGMLKYAFANNLV